MGQTDQTVALRVAAGEQRPARRRAQRRGGMRAREDDALRRELVESRAGDVRVAVGPEVAAEVVPMNEQHVVPSRRHRISLRALSVHRTVPTGIRQPFGSQSKLSPEPNSSTGWG